ncbi:hypothetical protein [Salinicola avicenniae]|uniref:hypothetical protein n=1 Tax=Salinicola avicenniae TaxID=2916836 RepID=UPI0020733B1A|nr:MULTISPECIES: hypothetical protein [unclassified Salinicola]
MANYAWVISMVAMTVAFPTFFLYSATRRRGMLPTALTAAAVAIIAALVAGFGQ